MANVHPSSLIGAQAYAVQLRRQYGQEETARAINLDDRQTGRSNSQGRRAAFELERSKDEDKKPAAGAKADNARTLAAGNPTVGEVTPRSNPPARPLFSSTNREAPNPNAQLRNTRPGTHLDITV